MMRILSSKSTRLAILFTGVLFTSCLKEQDLYQDPKKVRPSIDELFDFSTEQTCHLNIDYCLKDYLILFEIYDENPFEETSEGLIKKSIEPVYRASTDQSGKYSGDIVLPAYVQEVWLYSGYLGVVTSVKLEVKGGELVFNQDSYLKQSRSASYSRAVTGTGYKYPDKYKILGDWTDIYGTPPYLLDRQLPPADVLYGITDVFKRTGDYIISKQRPELFKDDVPVDLAIQKPTALHITFLNNTASMKNMLAYYVYKTGEKATKDNMQLIIAFPNSSCYYSPYSPGIRVGALVSGDRIQLKYWDGSKFLDEFPAGVTVGWVLAASSFDKGEVKNIGEEQMRYSTPYLNANGQRRAVSLHSSGNKLVAMGFEDNSDYNYGDAIFYVDYDTDGAIEPSVPDLPTVNPPTSSDNYVTSKGTITFEDSWPKQGDYDMNDVAVYYESKRFRSTANNKVVKCVDTYKVINSSKSATYKSAFGFQYSSLDNSDVKSVTIEGSTKSSFMQGQMLEPGQNHPTIILFDHATAVSGKTFTITTELKNEVPESMMSAPYNPFIIINSSEGRGKELHLATLGAKATQYLPTALADKTEWGTENDMTNETDNVYYAADDFMPFALHLSGVNFALPDETQDIRKTYSLFESWAKSKGTTNSDWYKKK